MDNTIERIDGYAKHYFSQLITWFTFFSTVNWAVLGWLSVSINKLEEGDTFIISIVALAFAIKNLLGILMCLLVMHYFIKTHMRLNSLEDDNNKNIFPVHLVVATCSGMILAILIVTYVWYQIWVKY